MGKAPGDTSGPASSIELARTWAVNHATKSCGGEMVPVSAQTTRRTNGQGERPGNFWQGKERLSFPEVGQRLQKGYKRLKWEEEGEKGGKKKKKLDCFEQRAIQKREMRIQGRCFNKQMAGHPKRKKRLNRQETEVRNEGRRA